MGEKRKLQRFELCLKGTVATTERQRSMSGCVMVFTRDISAGGAFFTTSNPFPIGTQVKVNLLMALAAKFPRLASRPFLQATGTVVRTDANGMAVSFKNNRRFASMALDTVLVAPPQPMAMANA